MRVVRQIAIFWNGQTSGLLIGYKLGVGTLKEFNILPISQIQAVSKINNRTHNSGFPVAPSSHLLLSPVQSTLGVAFPKIGSRPQPIEIPVAFTKCLFAGYQLLCDIKVATVIAQNERRRETGQAATSAFLRGPPNFGRSCPSLV